MNTNSVTPYQIGMGGEGDKALADRINELCQGGYKIIGATFGKPAYSNWPRCSVLVARDDRFHGDGI